MGIIILIKLNINIIIKMEKSMKEIKGDLSKSYSKFLDNYLKEKGDEFEKELEK